MLSILTLYKYSLNNTLKLKKIVITGAPGTGKTTMIKALKSLGYKCFSEYSRTLIRQAGGNKIKNLFYEKPKLFSKKVLEGRINQFNESNLIKKSKNNLIFFDRSIYDTFAYQKFIDDSFVLPINYKSFIYDKVFILPPWNQIYINDKERLESFEISKKIHKYLNFTYNHYNYNITEISKTNVKNRVKIILKSCQ